jgi:hypothetical protein
MLVARFFHGLTLRPYRWRRYIVLKSRRTSGHYVPKVSFISPLLDHILSHLNPVHTVTSYHHHLHGLGHAWSVLSSWKLGWSLNRNYRRPMFRCLSGLYLKIFFEIRPSSIRRTWYFHSDRHILIFYINFPMILLCTPRSCKRSLLFIFSGQKVVQSSQIFYAFYIDR